MHSMCGNTCCLRLINPASLHANLDEILALGPGCNCVEETAHTDGKIASISARASKASFHTVLGPPVPLVRGTQRLSPMHAGVGVLSSFPVWVTPGSREIAYSHRSLDTMLQVAPSIQIYHLLRTCCQCITVKPKSPRNEQLVGWEAFPRPIFLVQS